MTTSFEELCLLPGQPLIIELDSYGSFRDKSLYIGMKHNGSLLISTPIVNGSTIPVQVGQHLNIRFFANQANCACAFRTEVLYVSKNPYGHLHIAVPESLEIGEVRNSTRARVHIKAQLVFGKEDSADGEKRKQVCEVIDLSVNGAKVESDEPMGRNGVMVTLLMKLKLHEIRRVIRVEAEIKSLTHDERRSMYRAGLQFKSLSETDRLMLYAFVYAHLFES